MSLTESLTGFWSKYWFLILLVLLIALGMGLGLSVPGALLPLLAYLDPRVTTAVITLLMSVSLNGEKLSASLRAPGPVLLGFTVNVLIVPLLGMVGFALQSNIDLKYGILVAASVPCTLAAASVWTRKAGGNDAVSLLVTMTTSLVCFVTTPFWLSVPGFLAGTQFGSAEGLGAVTLSSETRVKLAVDLVFGALVPTLLGQALRQIPVVRHGADRKKSLLGGLAQVLILSMVLVAAVKAGARLGEADGGSIGIKPFVAAFLSVIAIHVAAYFIGTGMSRKLKFRLEDQIAVGLAGSQKTLPTGLLIATELGRSTGMTFALFPMLMYHACQLLLDTIFVASYSRKIAAESERPSR